MSLLYRCFFALALLLMQAMPLQAQVLEIEAGAITGTGDAPARCPAACGARGWNGNSRITVPTQMLVCSCGAVAPAAMAPPPQPTVILVPQGRPTSCSVAGNPVCAGCSVSCPAGKQATCSNSEIHQPEGFSPVCWTRSKCECG